MAKKKSGRSSASAKRSHGALIAVIALLLVCALLAGACLYFFVYKGYTVEGLLNELGFTSQPIGNQDGDQDDNQNDNQDDNQNGDQDGENGMGTVETEELSIHFLELGNKYAGDCTLIKIGDTEALIDAGSRQNSAATIVPYIRQYCTDGILEYVIVTHADQDHIAAFVGTNSAPGVFDSFICNTIIDFPRTDKSTAILKSYYAKRDAEVEAGAVHYTALQCWNETDGASKSYQLADDVTMNILYNYYYENKSSDENNYSVCMLLTQGEYNYLFTGDLEAEGEEYLVHYNALPQCKLFKGGHHGSKTSSTDALLSVIQPEIVCVCCCAGSPEYTTNYENMFPTQDFIDRVARYTDQIFVTTLATDVVTDPKSWEFTSMNGNIVITSNGVELSVWGSNNSKILKETEWFLKNRTWPSYGK